jgi:hypothetical protein
MHTLTHAMHCPACAEIVEPLAGSTWFLTWYLCRQCDHFWSARIRDGRPVIEHDAAADDAAGAAAGIPAHGHLSAR